MPIQISGKLILREGCVSNGADVTIELPPVNPQDIQEGDEVWVKEKVKMGYSGFGLFCDGDITLSNIIAHFPQSKPEEPNQKDGCCYLCGQKWSHHDPEKCKPQQEFCECKEPMNISSFIMSPHCGNCNRLIKPSSVELPEIDKTKLQEIIFDHDLCDEGKLFEILKYLREKK